MKKPPCAVIADGYSSGRYLAPEFARLGLDSVHVRSGPGLIEDRRTSFRPGDFTAEFGWKRSVEELSDDVATAWSPVAVLAGSDTGVATADALAQRFGLPGNDPLTSALRRDKHAMTSAVSARAYTARQHVTTNREDAITWARRQRNWPIVVKPVASTGSDHVAYCGKVVEVGAAFDRILGHENLLDQTNDRVLLQTYLEGPQFVVNAVSRKRQHVFTDIWRIAQRAIPGGAGITDHKWSLLSDDPLVPQLTDYVSKVLQACGIEEGPSHTEVRLTRRGPALIETAARLMGASLEAEPFLRAFGRTQPRLATQSAIDPAVFDEALNRGYRVHEGIAIFHLNVGESGVVCGIPGASILRSLPSFHALFGLPKIGSTVQCTTVNIARAGFVYLLNKDQQRLQSDIAVVRRLCHEGGLFDIEPDHRRPGSRQAKSLVQPRATLPPMTNAA